MDQQFDLAVIGGGPGGYVAAIRAAQLGFNTACIEREEALGGTCLRVGCIPSKALLESSERYHATLHDLAAHGVTVDKVGLDLGQMLKRKDEVVQANTSGIDFLFKKNKVTRLLGHAAFTGPGKLTVKGAEGEASISARYVIIATGSNVAELKGIEFDWDLIGGSTEALSYSEVPKRLIVIGAGYIGLELGSVWARLGSEVIVLEYLDRILPGMDSDIAKDAARILKKQGLDIRTGKKVISASKAKGKGKSGCVVMVEGDDAPLECDRVMVSVGRTPNTDGLNLKAAGVGTDQRGFVKVNERWQTNVANHYAIGDVIGGMMLAHKAEDEGMACVEYIKTGYGHVTYDSIPGIVYTWPEIASVGQTEDQLKEAGVRYRKGEFLFKANGRARALGYTDGKVKILADAETDRVLGIHILGPHAGDLIAECAMAMEFRASSEDIARTCHAHPTLAEAVKEAALAVDGRAIHA
jgi:dihydrolipoamide dehydrogenase